MRSFVRQPLARQVLEYLSDLIAEGTWPPGTALPPENELCADLGVSRPVLRECIRVLASRGMLVTNQGKGTFVCHPSAWNIAEPISLAVRADTEQLLNWSEVRAALECATARLAALRCDPTSAAEVKARLADCEKAQTPEEYLAADIAFHLAIADASGNPQFPRLLGPLLRPLRQQLSSAAAMRALREAANREHTDLATAILSGDPVAAADLASAHILRVRAEIRDIGHATHDSNSAHARS